MAAGKGATPAEVFTVEAARAEAAQLRMDEALADCLSAAVAITEAKSHMRDLRKSEAAALLADVSKHIGRRLRAAQQAVLEV